MPRFVYVTRSRCSCGFLWSTPGSGSVLCSCGSSAIIDDVPSGEQLAFTDDEFVVAVAADVGIPVDDVTVEPA